MAKTVEIRGVGITLDLLLWREFGRRGNDSDVVRRALEANPGLAGLGLVIPLGTAVIVPDLPPEPRRVSRKAVSLFDR